MANKLNNLTGKTFGSLYVIERDLSKNYPKPYWICRCECGTIKSIRGNHLTAKTKPTRSCGCLAKKIAADLCKERFIDLTGQTFNELKVIERVYPENKDNKRVYWKCQCSCGNIVIIRGDTLKEQISCGCSSISKGERKIAELLNNLGIEFETQKTFPEMKNNIALRLDFFIQKLNIAIEYQGQQHYYETSFYNDSLETRQKRDQIKRDYCKKNNIKLIEIPYWDYDKLNEDYLQSLF